MDKTSIVLVVCLAFVVLKPQLLKLVDKAKEKLKRENKEDKVTSAIYLADSLADNRHKAAVGELNHIKGQLQELLHRAQEIKRDPLLAEVNGDVKALFQRLEVIANQVPQQSVADLSQTYLQSLASLAKGTERVLEGQEKTEKLLIQVLQRLS